MKQFTREDVLRLGHQVFEIEMAGLRNLNAAIGKDFVAAIEAMVACKGHVVVIGMGKSGHIGNKI